MIIIAVYLIQSHFDVFHKFQRSRDILNAMLFNILVLGTNTTNNNS